MLKSRNLNVHSLELSKGDDVLKELESEDDRPSVSKRIDSVRNGDFLRYIVGIIKHNLDFVRIGQHDYIHPSRVGGGYNVVKRDWDKLHSSCLCLRINRILKVNDLVSKIRCGDVVF